MQPLLYTYGPTFVHIFATTGILVFDHACLKVNALSEYATRKAGEIVSQRNLCPIDNVRLGHAMHVTHLRLLA